MKYLHILEETLNSKIPSAFGIIKNRQFALRK